MKNYTKIFFGTESGETEISSYEEYVVMRMADLGVKIVYIVFKNENNRPHRTDGPALETTEGKEFYWLNGKLMHKEEYVNQLNMLNAANTEQGDTNGDQKG